MKPLIKLVLVLFSLLAGCQSDLQTKRLAEENLKGQPSVTLISGYLDLRYTENEGIGFSMFENLRPSVRRPALSALQGLTALAVAAFLWISRRQKFFTLLPLVLVLAGAIGNTWDRIRYGYVIDFIHFHVQDHFSWPVFNIADVLIAVGVGLLILQSFLQKEGGLLNVGPRPQAG